jgi:hypothetical protein
MGRHQVLVRWLQLPAVVTVMEAVATPLVVLEEVVVGAWVAFTVFRWSQQMAVLEQRTRARQVEMAGTIKLIPAGAALTGAMVVVEVAVVRQPLVQMVEMLLVFPVVVVQEVAAGME